MELKTSLKRTVLHEIGHVLLTAKGVDHTPSGVMATQLGIGEMLAPENMRFLKEYIERIQRFSRANL